MKTRGIKIDEGRGYTRAIRAVESFGVPIPRVFCRYIVDLFDSKGVEVLADDKECGRVCGERS